MTLAISALVASAGRLKYLFHSPPTTSSHVAPARSRAGHDCCDASKAVQPARWTCCHLVQIHPQRARHDVSAIRKACALAPIEQKRLAPVALSVAPSYQALASGSYSSEPRCDCHGVTLPAHGVHRPPYLLQSNALQADQISHATCTV